MTRDAWLGAAALVSASLCTAGPRDARAQSHRVAAVHPDAELVRALEVALVPWDVAVVAIDLAGPGPTMPIAVDRARAIAREARADVVVWISDADEGSALWIYDAASDQARARALTEPPPFSATGAAAVALAVKALLRGTVVAPPPERSAATSPAANVLLGADWGAAFYPRARGESSPFEARIGLDVSVWPRVPRFFGVLLQVETGTGLPVHHLQLGFEGTVHDSALRLEVGLHCPVAEAVSVNPSVGGGLHLLTFTGILPAHGQSPASTRLDPSFESGVGLGIRLLGDRVRVEPWVGVSVLARWQRFLVDKRSVFELGAISLEGALRVALALP
jgi:hypothetical protein